MSFGGKVTGALVYKQRMDNVKTSVRTVIDASILEGVTNLAKGFGHNNRALLRGIGIKR